jgi:alkanesulfonate monooxygenase SsuD/methylene tetrahydromethanopterin reductase-like flavin-dependent oxidoreductase (luciferase family)
VFGAAIAARTKNLRLMIAALIAPLHDPIRLAEDIAVLDVLSNGRVIPVVSGGYVESEFRAFGKRLSDRARVMEEIVPCLDARVDGRAVRAQRRDRARDAAPGAAAAPADLHGRRLAPLRRAAPRATRPLHADGSRVLFDLPRGAHRSSASPIRVRCRARPATISTSAEDPDAAWRNDRAVCDARDERVRPVDVGGRLVSGPYQPIRDPDALRKHRSVRIMTPAELIETARGMGGLDTILFHPLMGGMDPELSWASLRLFEAKVLPALRAQR